MDFSMPCGGLHASEQSSWKEDERLSDVASSWSSMGSIITRVSSPSFSLLNGRTSRSGSSRSSCIDDEITPSDLPIPSPTTYGQVNSQPPSALPVAQHPPLKDDNDMGQETTVDTKASVPSPPPLSFPKAGPVRQLTQSLDTPLSPTSPAVIVDLTQQIRTVSADAVAHGGFSDIYRGEWSHGQVQAVAIKLLRVLTRQDINSQRARKRLNREVYVWHRLDHTNIVKLYGTSYHIAGRPAMIMQWYQNGSCPNYLENHPEADRLALIRDIAEGLAYLHTATPPIVHGDLKASNALITDDGHAVLSDFGLSQVIEDLRGPTGNTTTSIGGSLRWQAPELVLVFGEEEDDRSPPLTPQSDIWSFGCVIYELLTGKLPFHWRHIDIQVIQDMMKMIKPSWCEDASTKNPSDGIWKLMDHCLSFATTDRPLMDEVNLQLQSFVALDTGETSCGEV